MLVPGARIAGGATYLMGPRPGVEEWARNRESPHLKGAGCCARRLTARRMRACRADIGRDQRDERRIIAGHAEARLRAGLGG